MPYITVHQFSDDIEGNIKKLFIDNLMDISFDTFSVNMH